MLLLPLVASALFGLVTFRPISALPLPFGPTVGDTFTFPNDDDFSIEFALPLPMLFFDEPNESVFHNTNGDITFGSGYSTFTPDIIPTSLVPAMIAIYWCDIDTRNGGNNTNELYARVSREEDDLDIAGDIVHRLGGAALDFTPLAVFVATWNNVEAYFQRTGSRNTFQLTVAWNEDTSYAILAYDKLEFFATDTGTFAVVGFNDQFGTEGSLIDVIEDNDGLGHLVNGTNIGTPGLYAYRVDGGTEVTGCTNSMAQPRLEPQFGPQVGGTVIRIQDLPDCVTEVMSVYCRFQSEFAEVVQEGFRASESTVECLTPFMGHRTSVAVGYAVHPSTGGAFDRDTAEWVEVTNRFQYFQPRPGAVIADDTPQLIESDEAYTIEWSSFALLTEAENNLREGTNFTDHDISVRLEILATAIDPSHPPGSFAIVNAVEIDDIDVNEATFTIAQADIDSYMSAESGFLVAVCLVRLVAYEGDRVAATRTTDLVGAMPAGENVQGGVCPLEPSSLVPCTEDLQNPDPCPPTYATASADERFSDDGVCTFPDGDEECGLGLDIDLNIALDIDYTCFINFLQPSSCSASSGISIDPSVDLYAGGMTACGCSTFHAGAAGCVRGGGTQCCYASSGDLITDPEQGAGTADCNAAADGISIAGIAHIINDVWPFILCCKIMGGGACDDYYEKRPAVRSDGYVLPNLPSRTNGDPHLRTFDGIDYDFNGAGEYVAVCGVQGAGGTLDTSSLVDACTPFRAYGDDTLAIHYRFAPLNEGDAGTVTVAFAVQDRGETLAVVPHPTRRIDVYDGANRVIFPLTPEPRTEVILLRGLRITRTSDITETQLHLHIVTPSGIRVEGTEVNGVWVLSTSLPESMNGRSIGLLGRMDGDITNDFTNADGAESDLDASSETLFNEFGQSWMIHDEDLSLFQNLAGSAQAFSNFYAPEFVPIFEAPVLEGSELAAAEAACAFATTESIRRGCIFDIAVTGDVETIAAVTEIAEAEQRERVDVISNSLPRLAMSTVRVEVRVGEAASIDISASDAGGEVGLQLDRSDGDFFTLSDDGDLFFEGTNTAGTYVAIVSVSGEFGAVPFTATVRVTDEPLPQTNAPSDAPSDSPSARPTSTMPTEVPSIAPRTSAPTTPGPTTMAPTTTAPVAATHAPSKLPSAAPVQTRKSECQSVVCVVARLFIVVWRAFEKFLVKNEYGNHS